jgi:hypothetical protein
MSEAVSIKGGGIEVNTTIGNIAALNQGIKLNEVRAAVPELEACCNMKIQAAEKFANLVKLVALKAGLDATVLSTYITAVCNQTLNKKQKQAEQLSLLFEELA